MRSEVMALVVVWTQLKTKEARKPLRCIAAAVIAKWKTDSRIGQFATKMTRKAHAQTAHLQFTQADPQIQNCKRAVF